MNAQTEPATIEDSQNVVAIQLNHDLIKFSKKLCDVNKLIDESQQFKQLNADDKPQYDLAVKAIAEVRTMRTDIDKERKIYKAPVTEFGKAVEERAKILIVPLRLFEDELKLEKQRIDDIKAERKAAIREAELRQRQEQLDRVNGIRMMHTDTHSMSVKELNEALEEIASIASGLNPNHFGESFNDAEQACQGVRIRLNSAIAQAEQAAELKRQQKQAEADRLVQRLKDDDAKAERDSIARAERAARAKEAKAEADKAAAQQKIIDDQQAEMDRLRKAAEPKPQPEPVKEMDDDQFIDGINMPDVVPDKVEITNPVKGKEYTDLEADIGDLYDFIAQLYTASSSAPKPSNQYLRESVDHMMKSMNKFPDFLLGCIAKAKEDVPQFVQIQAN